MESPRLGMSSRVFRIEQHVNKLRVGLGRCG
jgi:hypothetical protein